MLKLEQDKEQGKEVLIIWSADDDVRSAWLFDRLAALEGVTIVRIVHGGPADRFDQQPVLGMADTVLLGEADEMIATSRSSFSYVAHGRALLRPRYTGIMLEGATCSLAPSSEAGLVHVTDMHSDCRQTDLKGHLSYNDQQLTCKKRRRGCVSLSPGGFFSGMCLQEQKCLKEHNDSYFHEWAAPFDVGIDVLGLHEYRWARDGFPTLRTMYPHSMRSCSYIRPVKGDEGIGKKILASLESLKQRFHQQVAYYSLQLQNITAVLTTLEETANTEETERNQTELCELVPNCCSMSTATQDRACDEEILEAIRWKEDDILQASKKQIAHACSAKDVTSAYASKWGIEYDAEAEFNVDASTCDDVVVPTYNVV